MGRLELNDKSRVIAKDIFGKAYLVTNSETATLWKDIRELAVVVDENGKAGSRIFPIIVWTKHGGWEEFYMSYKDFKERLNEE